MNRFYRWHIDTEDKQLILPLFKTTGDPSILCLWYTETRDEWVYTDSEWEWMKLTKRRPNKMQVHELIHFIWKPSHINTLQKEVRI